MKEARQPLCLLFTSLTQTILRATLPAVHTPVHNPDALRRKALRLEYTLIAYNTLEAVIAIAAGWRAGSVALVSWPGQRD